MNKMKKTLISLLGAIILFGGYIFPVNSQPVIEPVEIPVGTALPQGTALFQTSLQSRILSTDSSMTLTENSVRGGSALSGFNCFTVDEGKAEVETICGIVSGTSVTSLQRGIDPSNGTSTNSTLRFDHRRGAIVKITDFPLIQIMRNQLSGNDYFDNLLLYSSTTSVCGVGTASTTLCPKGYFDTVIASGAPNSDETTKGIAEAGTASEQASSTATGGTGAVTFMRTRYATDTPTAKCNTSGSANGSGCSLVALMTGKISQLWLDIFSTSNTWTGAQTQNATNTFNGVNYIGQFADYRASTTIAGSPTAPLAVFVATATNALWMSNASIATTSDFLGFTKMNLTNGATGSVQISGVVSGFTGLTAGQPYYVQNTAGTIGTSIGTAELYVGTAISETQLLLDRKDANWQYLGSQTCGTASGATYQYCDTPAVPYARFAVVKSDVITGAAGDQGCFHSFMVSKYGVTTITYSTGQQQSSNVGTCITVATFTSTSSIRFQIGSTIASNLQAKTQTAYFYR